MRIIYTLTIVLLLGLIVPSAVLSWKYYDIEVEGVIYFRDKRPPIYFDRFKAQKTVFDIYFGDGEEDRISLKDIKSFEFLDPQLARDVRITMRNGKVLIVRYMKNEWGTYSGGSFIIKYGIINPKNGDLQYERVTFRKGYSFHSHILKIIFSDNVGDFRTCPKCGRIQPRDYIYCPYDSTRLIWGGDSLKQQTTEAAKKTRRSPERVLDAILDASLIRSGIDPASEEARQAKEFGKLWLNPLSDPKKIHQKIDEFRQEWIKKTGEN